MESLNLNTLATSLPTGQQNAEKELMNNFKAAALSITTLYRSSRQNAKKAYNAGYAAACEDLLSMIQQGVSVGGIGASGSGSHSGDESGMTIGRVMDWIEARIEAIKSREEEEDEDEEKEKERAKPSAPPRMPKPDIKANPAVQSTREPKPSLPTPNSPHTQSTSLLPVEPTTPSPPPAAPLRPTQRPARHKPSAKGDSAQFPAHTSSSPNFNFAADNQSTFPELPLSGTKRRHAVMMMLDSTASPVSLGGTSTSNSPSTGGMSGNYAGGIGHNFGASLSRRRTRSSRNLPLQQQGQNQNFNVIQASAESMDVEEDGRERKRVARERR